MATTASNTAAWLAQLQAEPWYTNVWNAFNAAGIPDDVWATELDVEDTGLNVAQVTNEPDGSLSYGLFQLNNRGVGAGEPIGTLEDAYGNATIAAKQMAADIAAGGATGGTETQMITALEKDWPGNTGDNATRQAVLGDIQNAGNPAFGTEYSPGGSGPPAWAQQLAKSTAQGIASGVGLSLPSTAQINTWLTNATIAAVLLAIVAGGFTLLAGPQVAPIAKDLA